MLPPNDVILKIVTSPILLSIFSIAILIIYMLRSNSNFLNIRKVFKDYLSIFKDAKKHLFVFWGVPILLAIAVVQVTDVTGKSAESVIVFLSILISAFFATLSILISKQTDQSSELYKQVLKETASLVLLEIILCIVALVISIMLAIIDVVIPMIFLIILNFFDYYLIFVMLINLLILIKRMKALIDNA